MWYVTKVTVATVIWHYYLKNINEESYHKFGENISRIRGKQDNKTKCFVTLQSNSSRRLAEPSPRSKMMTGAGHQLRHNRKISNAPAQTEKQEKNKKNQSSRRFTHENH